MSELFKDIASIVGFIGGCIGIVSGWYTFRKTRLDLRKLELEEENRKKADIRVKVVDDFPYSDVSIQNIGSSIAKNVKVKVLNKQTNEVLDDRFEDNFPSVLNVGQESIRTWMGGKQLSRYGENTVIIVSWNDDFEDDRMLEQTVRY